MPNRILKESILDSPTLAKLDDFYQDQFPRLLLLADDWGCFNADPAVIKGKAYPKRAKITDAKVGEILKVFYEAGLLFMWRESDRIWAYWISWEEHNYCSGSSVDEAGNRVKFRRKTPEPPKELVDAYMERYGTKRDTAEQSGTEFPITIKIPITHKNKKIGTLDEKLPFGENGKVELTREEHGKLIEKFGAEGADDRIQAADLYFGSKGKASDYSSHYLAILNWDRMSQKKAQPLAVASRASPAKHVHSERCKDYGFCPEERLNGGFL